MLELLLVASTTAAPCPEHQQVLRAAAAVIESTYVESKKGAQIARAVRDWSVQGRYDVSCTDPESFLWELNRSLDAYDGHFHVERVTGASTAGDDWLMAWRAQAGPNNAGVWEVKVMEGNIGYLRLTSFYPWDIAKSKLTHAFHLLGDAAGLILDLRQNGGGDADTANQIVRSFLGDKAASVQRIESRAGTRLDPLPAPDMPAFAGPVVVLVDRRSASASEFVAYSLQAAGRGTVVGARSAGAASMLAKPAALPDGYQIHVPNAQPVNVTTGRNWEGVGVVPDVSGGDDPVYIARQILADAAGKKAP